MDHPTVSLQRVFPQSKHIKIVETMSNDLEPMRVIAKGFLLGQIASNLIKHLRNLGNGVR
ncbi:MAG: hypothetical protein A2Z14_17840 [Chloroflexi bacterium RBG_16_48_8]|nr:MAG: hypothetical protein A2Z14_17840 [Chloroflexi bacterium RBG_16_48_8]